MGTSLPVQNRVPLLLSLRRRRAISRRAAGGQRLALARGLLNEDQIKKSSA